MKAKDYPFDPVRICCAKCGRQCLYTRAEFVAAVGAETGPADALARISMDCPKRRNRKGYDQCTLHYPDLPADTAD